MTVQDELRLANERIVKLENKIETLQQKLYDQWDSKDELYQTIIDMKIEQIHRVTEK